MNINTAYFTSQTAVGGSGGGEFYYGVKKGQISPSSGAVVRLLKAWYDSNTMRGIQIELTNGGKHSFGRQEGTQSQPFYFADGETIQSLKIWASDHDTGRCGGFELITNEGRKFDVDARRTGDPYQPEIGSGILVGLFGRAGADIDCLGFALLRRVESAVLVNVDYPDISTLQVKTKPRQIQTITYDNSDGTVEQTFTFSGSESVEETETWSVTAGIETSVSTEVQAGIPIIAEGSVTASLSVSVSGTYERSTKKTTVQSFNFPVTVPPGKRMLASATLYEGNIDTEYTGKMVFTLDSGKSFNYEVNGIYSGVSASQAVVKTDED